MISRAARAVTSRRFVFVVLIAVRTAESPRGRHIETGMEWLSMMIALAARAVFSRNVLMGFVAIRAAESRFRRRIHTGMGGMFMMIAAATGAMISWNRGMVFVAFRTAESRFWSRVHWWTSVVKWMSWNCPRRKVSHCGAK